MSTGKLCIRFNVNMMFAGKKNRKAVLALLRSFKKDVIQSMNADKFCMDLHDLPHESKSKQIARVPTNGGSNSAIIIEINS